MSEMYAAFAVIFVLLVNTSGLDYGEKCQTPDRKRGSCIGIRECLSLVDTLKSKPIQQSTIDFLRESQCGYEGSDPLVCCSPNLTLSTATTHQPTQPTTNTEVTEDVSRHRNLGLLKPKICGEAVEFRIFLGNKNPLFFMPWLALVAYSVQSGFPFRCGGSIINDRYVLTAAHCVKFLPNGIRPISVRVGEHDLDSKIDCEEEFIGAQEDTTCAPAPEDIQIEEIVAHPYYTGKPNLQNDIALIRLSKAANFSESVQPVCLPVGLQQQSESLDGKRVALRGWGVTENGTTSHVITRVSVPVLPHGQCADAYKGTVPISSVSQLCTISDRNGGDSCPGDSGGPLTYLGNVHGHIRSIQHGVESFGHGNCDPKGLPGVYTRVGHFMNWILDNLKP